MDQTPLFLPTLVVLVVVALEWKSSRPVALSALFAGFVLLVAVMSHPGFSASEVVEYGQAMLAAPLAVARAVGAACFLYSVVRIIRTHEIPW